jgi:hypothetical protein
MKTTVEIPDPLFRRPLRQVFEQSLGMALVASPARRRRFRLKTVTTKGEGLVCDGDWSVIPSLIYEGHGG